MTINESLIRYLEAFYYYTYNTKLIGSPEFITELCNIRNTVFVDKKKPETLQYE